MPASTPQAFSLSTSPRSADKQPAHHSKPPQASPRFTNPWPSANPTTWTQLAASPFPLGWAQPPRQDHKWAREVKVVKPDWGVAELQKREREGEQGGEGKGGGTGECVVGTWLGHAGVLVQMRMPRLDSKKGGGAVAAATTTDRDGKEKENSERERIHLLFDPIFSLRAGPTAWTGPRRFKESPCQVVDLPGCDLVFISHNHYDHLDLATMEAVLKRFPRARYCVPLGMRRWFQELGVGRGLVWEADWWEEWELMGDELGKGETGTKIKITCVPAQHTSARIGTEVDSTLWCGWVVEKFIRATATTTTTTAEARAKNPPSWTRKGAVYHAGDTGYRCSARSSVVCPAFKEIGAKLGPFDLSFIPIWRGGTLGFISYLGLRLSHQDVSSITHTSPVDAVEIHRDVRSRNTVGIHFGTFVGSVNETFEAVVEFGEACEELGVGWLGDGGEEGKEGNGNGRAGVLDIGGSLVVETV